MPPWDKSEIYVTEKLADLDEKIERIVVLLQSTREEVVTLKVKSVTWGAIGGIIAAIIPLLAILLKKG